MNPKFKVLADIATVERYWSVDHGGYWVEKHVDLEEFALLIIDQCHDAALFADYNKHIAILEYFGVE